MAEQRRNSRSTKSNTPKPISEYGRIQPQVPRSEERRVGKEC